MSVVRIDTSRESVERHLAWRADHMDGSLDNATEPMLRTLLAERDAMQEALDWAYSSMPNEIDDINERAAANLARLMGEGNGN